jgi:mono/diheme cytochrome c family protein
MKQFSFKHWLLASPLLLVGLQGCTRDYKFQPVDMWNNSRLKPYEQVNFFKDKSSAQTPPAATVARSQDRLNEALYYGTTNGTPITYNPLIQGKSPEEKLAVLQRGQERYQIYCQPCHGLAGYGDGMIVQRGFSKPPSYHIPRLRNVADGYIFDVITNGYGSMYSYAGRVPPRDRWAIVAYIRTLQRSQNASEADVQTVTKNAKDYPEHEPPALLGPSAGRAAHGSQPGGAGEPNGNVDTGSHPE